MWKAEPRMQVEEWGLRGTAEKDILQHKMSGLEKHMDALMFTHYKCNIIFILTIHPFEHQSNISSTDFRQKSVHQSARYPPFLAVALELHLPY